MSDFEAGMLCFLVPVAYVLTYIAGKYDIITLVINMLQERADEYTRKKEGSHHEVVRCKECRWWNHAGCAIRIVDETDKPTSDDFCSFGERGDNNADEE